MSEETDYDVIVVGSGAGGMLAAIRAHDLGLRSVVIEKSPLFGGTSAISGGEFWIPGNELMAGGDSDEVVKDYLRQTSGGDIRPELLERYLHAGREMVHYLLSIGIQLEPHEGTPDYFSELPGGVGGRSLMVVPFDGAAALGDELFKMRPASPIFSLLDRYAITANEGGTIALRLPGWRRTFLRLLASYWLNIPWRRKTRRDRRLTLGGALVGSLRKAMLDRAIPLRLNTELMELSVTDGTVTGAVFRHLGQELRLTARCGVVLATGGFEHNQSMREQHFPAPTRAEWSMAPGTNAGDGIRAAQAVGGAAELLDQANWWPVTLLPGATNNTLVTHFMFRNPHSLCVNRLGKRFVDENCSYDRFGRAMIADHAATGATIPSWIVFDADCRRNYLCGGMLPGRIEPDDRLPLEWWDTYVFRAETLAGLARKIGVNETTLLQSVERMNQHAAAGKDPDFGRGDHPYDRILGGGDPAVGPNPCLAPVVKPPFYAMRIFLGDLGTKGGLRTDADARVMSARGVPIERLYAVGNTAASVFRNCYPGPGSTLGPAMTFAFVAATHIAQRKAQRGQQAAA
jgi:3-oxosteroid 1-dehydrogenase